MSYTNVIACGGREFDGTPEAAHAFLVLLKSWGAWGRVVLWHGDARGADRWAASVAEDCVHAIMPVPADWNTHGRAAGPIRNADMFKRATTITMAGVVPPFVIAFPGGRGTAHMVEHALSRGAVVYRIDAAGDVVLSVRGST